MKRTLSLLLFVVLTAVAASAFGQETKYRAPRTESGQPDLQGMWNFNTGVPLQRPAAFSDRKFFTREEFDKQRAAIRNGLGLLVKFAPVEAIGLDWMDDAPPVDELRTSLITHPENGRLPALVKGVRRMPGIDDLIAALGNVQGGAPQSLFAAFASFGGGNRDSYTDFMMSERCLVDGDVPFVPQLDGNYLQIIQGRDHRRAHHGAPVGGSSPSTDARPLETNSGTGQASPRAGGRARPWSSTPGTSAIARQALPVRATRSARW